MAANSWRFALLLLRLETSKINTSINHRIGLLLSCSHYSTSRRVQKAIKKNELKDRRMASKQIMVIDSDGNNKGTMSMHLASQIAESEGMELIQVAKTQDNMEVYRMMTKKEIYQKNKENKNRKNPLSIIKDIKISTAISEHDLDIKVDNIRKIFQKRNQVKVLIMPKLKNYQMEVEELRLNEEEKQKDLLKSICEDLEGAGTMVGKETWIGKNVVALFKPLSITQK